MIIGNRAFSGLGDSHRKSVLLAKIQHLLFSLAVEHAAANDDQRFLGLFQRIDGCGQFGAVGSLPTGGPQPFPEKVHRVVKGFGLDILTQSQSHRPAFGRVGQNGHGPLEGRHGLFGAGDPVELYAYGKSRDPQRPELFDHFSAMFRYGNGAYAVVSQTLAAFEHHQTVKVAGTKGAVWAGWSGAADRTLQPTFFLKVFADEKLEDVRFVQQSGEVFELRAQIARCVQMVRGEARPAADGRDGLWSAGLCLLAEESIRQGRPLPVGEMLA